MNDTVFSTTSPPIETLQQIIVAKNLFLAALSIIIFDHLLTFPSEVFYVWDRQKSFVLWLFLAIRYYAIAALTIVTIGYFSPLISGEACVRWSVFLPLGITMPLSIGPSILLTVRVYAMYGRSKSVLVILGTILCVQFAAGLWQYTVKGGRVAPDPINNYLFHYCIYLPPSSLHSISTMYVFFDLGFNAILFVMTLVRTFWVYWERGNVKDAGFLVKTLARNGAMYFAVIFCTNLAWALMILHAPTGLRGIMSQPTAALTTIMMSRITLNLRESGNRKSIAVPRMNEGRLHLRKASLGSGEDELERGGFPLEIRSRMDSRAPNSDYPPRSPGVLVTSHTLTFQDSLDAAV